MIGKGDIAVLVDHHHMTLCGHRVGVLIIVDPFGVEGAALLDDLDVTHGGNDLGVAVVIHLIGLQQDGRVPGRRLGRGGTHLGRLGDQGNHGAGAKGS